MQGVMRVMRVPLVACAQAGETVEETTFGVARSLALAVSLQQIVAKRLPAVTEIRRLGKE